VRIDIAGLRPERVAVVPSPLAELGMALHALSEPGHHPGLQGWVTGVLARLDPHLADRMCDADFLWTTTFADLFLPYAGIPGGAALPGATLAEELDLLDKLTDEQFVNAALEFSCATCYDVGSGWLVDAEQGRRALELAAASPAITLDEGAAEITVDKLSVGRTTTGDGPLILVPTSLGWPHLAVLYRPGWQPVVHYPVGSPELAAPPSVEQLALRMTALSHPVRMRICRHLARSAWTTSELAQAHGMTAPEISRHLSVLKKAGLITTRRRGRYVQHQLDIAVVARLGSDFLEGILR